MVVVQGVCQTRPLHLNSEAHSWYVDKMEVVILARCPHEHVKGSVHLDDSLFPVELKVGETEVHLLRGVVRVETGMEKELSVLGGQEEAAVQHQADLVPPGEGGARVQTVT